MVILHKLFNHVNIIYHTFNQNNQTPFEHILSNLAQVGRVFNLVNINFEVWFSVRTVYRLF